MGQITVRLPEDLLHSLDDAASRLRSTRAEMIRQAIEYYLEDFEDISQAIQVLNQPTDPVLSWDEVNG